jgi:hypothetical protein
LLTLNVTISGLTFSNSLAYGIAGIEHYIADLATTLGALDLRDEFVFAAPYKGALISAGGGESFYKTISAWTFGERVGPLLFVKKRVTAELTIGGLTLRNLAIFEDVNFPSPYARGIIDVNGDGQYDATDQLFALGDLLTISGETVSGIEVTSMTGFCLDWYYYYYFPKHQLLKIYEYARNRIKKKTWNERVEPECAWWAIPAEGGGYKTPILFTKELISIRNIPLPSGITVDSLIAVTPVAAKVPMGGVPPFFTDIVFQMPILGLADLLVEFWTDNPDQLNPSVIVWTIQLPEHGWSIHWYDYDGDLTMTVADLVDFKSSLKFQEAVTINNFIEFVPTIGLYDLELQAEIPISWPEPYGYLELDFDWDWDTATRKLVFDEWAVRLYKEMGHNDFKFTAAFDKYGFKEAGIDISVTWSI